MIIKLELPEDDVIRLLTVHLAAIELMENRKQVYAKEYVMLRHSMTVFYYAVKDKVNWENKNPINLLLTPPPLSLSSIENLALHEKYNRVLEILRSWQREDLLAKTMGMT